MQKTTRWVLGILALAAVLRVAVLIGVWQDRSRVVVSDSRYYISLADSLAESGTFSWRGLPDVYRTPGYPVFLLLGKPFGESGWRVILLLQILLDVSVVYVTFLLGRELCREGAALWAAAFQAVCVLTIAMTVRLLTETCFLFLTLLGMLMAVRHFKTAGWGYLIASAVAFGVAAYIRPVSPLFVAIVLLMLLFRPRRIRRCLAYAGIFAAVVLPWCARNYAVAGTWKFTHALEFNDFHYAAPRRVSRQKGLSVKEARKIIQAEYNRRYAEDEKARPPSQVEVYRRKGQVARSFLRDPWALRCLKAWPTSTAFWLPKITQIWESLGVAAGGTGALKVFKDKGIVVGAWQYFGGNVWLLVLSLPFVGLLGLKYSLAAVCVVARVRSFRASEWMMVLSVVLLQAVAGGEPRFRAPITPVLSVAAAAGLVMLWDRFRRIRKSSGSAAPVAEATSA